MEAKERAEKIAKHLDKLEITPYAIGVITAAISEAEREAELRAKASYEHELHLAHRIVDGVKALNDHQVEIGQQGYAEGFRDAIEKATELAHDLRIRQLKP